MSDTKREKRENNICSNAACIASYIDTANLQTSWFAVLDCVNLFARALADIEESEELSDLLWETSETDWESLCSAIAKRVQAVPLSGGPDRSKMHAIICEMLEIELPKQFENSLALEESTPEETRKVTSKDIAILLAALRVAQGCMHDFNSMPQLEDVKDGVSSDEIDQICEEINCGLLAF